MKKSPGMIFHLTNINTILVPAPLTSPANYPREITFREFFTTRVSLKRLVVYYCVTSLVCVSNLKYRMFNFLCQHDLWLTNPYLENNRQVDAAFLYRAHSQHHNKHTLHNKLFAAVKMFFKAERYTEEQS